MWLDNSSSYQYPFHRNMVPVIGREVFKKFCFFYIFEIAYGQMSFTRAGIEEELVLDADRLDRQQSSQSMYWNDQGGAWYCMELKIIRRRTLVILNSVLISNSEICLTFVLISQENIFHLLNIK